MNARLTTAISIGDAAQAILRKTKSFPDQAFHTPGEQDLGEHVGVEPMLLALSMELALKAWFVFDYDDPNFARTHNLIELFESLKPESQEQLTIEFARTVVPFYPDNFYVDYSISHILRQHRHAFVDWRYLHEAGKAMSFNQSAFEATLEMVLREFRGRYRDESQSHK